MRKKSHSLIGTNYLHCRTHWDAYGAFLRNIYYNYDCGPLFNHNSKLWTPKQILARTTHPSSPYTRPHRDLDNDITKRNICRCCMVCIGHSPCHGKIRWSTLANRQDHARFSNIPTQFLSAQESENLYFIQFFAIVIKTFTIGIRFPKWLMSNLFYDHLCSHFQILTINNYISIFLWWFKLF